MHRSLKRNLVIGSAALALAAFAGGAYAATQTSGPSTRQAFLNDVAKRLHVPPQQLNSALNGAALDQLQAAVKAGQITQAQANALEQRLKNSGTAPLLPLAPGFAGPRGFEVPRGAFPQGPLGPGARPGPLGFGGAGLGLGAAASYLGLTNAQLFQLLQNGKSLAQIATAKGKTAAGLEQAMTAPVKKALDAAVASKAITAAREKQILSRYTASLSERINNKGLAAPQRGFFRGGGGAGPGLPYWAGPGGKGNGKGSGSGPSFVPPSAAPPTAPGAPASAPSGSGSAPGAAPAQLFMPAPTA